jgi:hypothetical protein
MSAEDREFQREKKLVEGYIQPGSGLHFGHDV